MNIEAIQALAKRIAYGQMTIRVETESEEERKLKKDIAEANEKFASMKHETLSEMLEEAKKEFSEIETKSNKHTKKRYRKK